MKSSATYPLRQRGIYRNLPGFDPSIKDLSALICGANGISGFATLRALLDAPERWTRIYTLSRSRLSDEQMSLIPTKLHSHIKQVQIDLTSSDIDIAKTLRELHIRADYIFFYSYLQPRHAEYSGMSVQMADTLVEANVPMFRNFLQGLELAELRPKRIALQTGGKSYGVHIGRARRPLVESDPQPRHLQPNFYYGQEDLLREFCERHPTTGWNVIRPAAIIGVAQRAPINAFYPFAVYAAIQAKKKEPLRFGGDFESWQYECSHCTARMTAYLTEWAVLEDHCANQAFNAQDASLFSWDRFFSELARWYGVKKGIENPSLDDSAYQMQTLAGGKEAPLGYGPPTTLRTTFRLGDWFQQPENKAAWEEIMALSDGQVKVNIFEDPAMQNLVSEFGYARHGNLSPNKTRIFGFSGFVDTLESLFDMYKETSMFGALPSMSVAHAHPLV